MSFAIGPGEKFGMVVLRNASTESFAKRLELDLGNGLWAINEPPVDVGATWREWIGSIQGDDIARANLWLIAKRPSATVTVVDQVSVDLKNTVWRWFLGLLLVGALYYEHAWRLVGAHVSGRPEIREYSEVFHVLQTQGARSLSVGESELRRALALSDGLRMVFGSDDHIRLRRGLRVFFDGLKQTDALERLHQFVRSVEAIVNPRIGSTRADMVDRCQTFTRRSDGAREVLTDCYELRNKAEHLWDWEGALPLVPPVDKQAVMGRRLRQIEELGRHVFSEILTSPTHLETFADAGIDGFWKQREHLRLAQWANPLDITGVS